MDSQIHQRLLLLAIFSILVFNFQNVAAQTDFSPESAPNLQPVISPSPQADTSFPPLGHVSFPPSESYSPSDSLPPSGSDSPDDKISFNIADSPSEAFASSNFDESAAVLSLGNVDPEIKKICDSTDYPSLCLNTIAPYLHGSTNEFSVLEVAIKAGNEYAKFALSTIRKLASTPGTPHEIVSILNDCKDSYEDVLYNFQKAMTALPERDIGTMNTMLSAVLTDAGDCEDAFAGANFPSPMSNFGEKLINMTSNCLAIVSLIH
ncbi:hypothetical protein ACH5RR_033538 [Cinchona calisaya]|uniref:Pectinesterase inhibitor domain-containing protein n=1 Tax=Cinchona calisaya TaxID=153742 RepID=A0ABD2YML2_9GENT